ncbi:MAG: hypothetical protein ACRD3B_10040 [Candidatus Sulfotelmatobacter sp.]
MKLITLHDHLNPSQEVEVDADSITSITPYGSGSAIQAGGSLIGVQESPAEVKEIIQDAG